MPLDQTLIHKALLHAHRASPARDFLQDAKARLGQIALVSSFGAESAVLLHMVAQIDRAWPVIFIDTRVLFPETLQYQRDLAQHLGLRDIRRIGPDHGDLRALDATGDLHLRDTGACCMLRKAVPLARALHGFDAWVTGRKRHQAATRAQIERVEIEPETGRLRLNPLADWMPSDITTYLEQHALPRHPLTAQGYPSIGCAPCTTRVASGEDTRAGRWRGIEKTECGIHSIGGVPQRSTTGDAR